MAYGVLIPKQIAAKNVDAWNRPVYCATARENGDVFTLLTKYDVANAYGDTEVWTATVPASSNSHLTDVWMAYEPELVWTGYYRGLDPDVRNFINPAGRIFTAFKPQLHDILLMSEDCFSAARGGDTYVFANCTNSTWQMVWGTTQTSVSYFTLAYLSTDYISIGTGALDTQRLTAYTMEVIAL